MLKLFLDSKKYGDIDLMREILNNNSVDFKFETSLHMACN